MLGLCVVCELFVAEAFGGDVVMSVSVTTGPRSRGGSRTAPTGFGR